MGSAVALQGPLPCSCSGSLGPTVAFKTWNRREKATVLDAERGEYIVLETGDKLVIPPGTLHAEGEVKDTMVFIVALPEARPFDRFLQTLPPDDPNRPGA